MAEWRLAGEARTRFADMIESLSPEQLEEQSLCGKWTNRDVLAHLTSIAETGLVSLLAQIARNRFDYDKASVAMVAARSDRTVADLAASLRERATKSAALPMFPEAMTVADVAIHTQDVRRPLGLGVDIDPDVVLAALGFLTTHKMAANLVRRPPLDGVHLRATDVEWTFGEGAEIAGPGEALMMTLANRPAFDELEGEGLAAWR